MSNHQSTVLAVRIGIEVSMHTIMCDSGVLFFIGLIVFSLFLFIFNFILTPKRLFVIFYNE